VSLPLAALRERVPGIDGRRVARVADGWDFDVYVVDDEWVVRVPRRPAVTRRVPPEVALLAILAPALPVLVPRFEAVGADGAAWVAYRRILGDPLAPGAPAEDVGAFLSALHAFPVASAAAAGIPAGDSRTAMAEELAEFEARVFPLLGASERRRADRAFRRHLEDDARFAFRPALVHADLGREHLLCGHDGRLRGVIDWTDARVGDPALDFAWLLHGLGEGFAGELLAAYEGEVDGTFRERAAFYHRLGPWHEVTYGLGLGRPDYVESGLAGIRERLR
jgi:aminoglycoside phosphotransferase (APT) family kinase protein